MSTTAEEKHGKRGLRTGNSFAQKRSSGHQGVLGGYTARCLAADGLQLFGALVRTTDTAHVDAHLEQRLSREYLPLIYQAHTTSLPQHLTSVLNFWANANCDGGLEIKAFDSHSDAGCSLLNLRG